jgi:diguanylate cyclase (GGDEF)-like protein
MTLSNLRHRWRGADRPSIIVLAAGAAFVAVYFGMLSRDAQDLLYQLPGVLAPIAVVAGVARNRPSDPRPWLLLALGLGLTSLGDWIWLLLDHMAGGAPFPSVADGAYLAGLAVIAVAILRLARGRIPGGDRAGLIDAFIVAVGAGLLSWTFIMAPLVADPLASSLEIGVALAYPLLDILLLGVLVRLILSPGRRVASLRRLLVALAALLLADFPYAVMSLDGGYYSGHIVELGWMAASFFWASAALHPSMRQVAEPARTVDVELPAWRLALLAAASLMAPGVVVIQAFMGMPIDLPVVVGGCVILFLLVIARLSGLVHQLRASLLERHTLERELERRALHDPLTGLPNRTLFYDRLSQALARRGERVGVFFMDLDDFKTVNDRLGHQAGDAVLCVVGDAIRGSLRPADTVARLGGDEFAVLLEGGVDATSAAEVAGRVLEAVSTPAKIGGVARSIGVSIGISIGASGKATAEELMREADIAMYVAKSHGKAGFTIFDPRAHEVVTRTIGLEADLERGIREGELELHYQPIVELASGEVVGVEALARWRHPTRGLLQPSDFIELAERTGTIVPLGRCVLEQAARQAASWGSTGPTSGGRFLSINFSALELVQPGTAEFVGDTIRESGLDPHQWLLEVTESVRPDPEAVASTLAELKALGVRIAIDDFGTGFASMSRLLGSHFDVIKLDKTLIEAMAEPRGVAAVNGIADLARRLEVQIVAEGIEDATQLAALRQIGCDLGQGYYFSRPLPADELGSILVVQGGAVARAPKRRTAPRRASAG